MFVLKLIIRNAFRHKLRTTLTVVGVAIAVLAFGLLRTLVGAWYLGVESSKGELGFYIVSDGTGHPWRMKIRSPSTCNLSALPIMLKGGMISDIVAVIGSVDPVMGEADK